MQTHQTHLLERKEVAEDTQRFVFEKPEGFQFLAGQFATLVLPNGEKPDRGRSHTFTLASAPCEENLMIVTRMRDSEFKHRLDELPIGGEAVLKGPSGSFTLPENDEAKVVFIAGGIGVTPFLSMLRQANHDRRPGKITLFYSNHRPEDAAFLGELQQLDQKTENYEVINTMTAEEESAREWKGESGHIDAAMLKRHVDDLTEPVYYVAGPPEMVSATEDMLRATKISNDHIRVEQFSGY